MNKVEKANALAAYAEAIILEGAARADFQRGYSWGMHALLKDVFGIGTNELYDTWDRASVWATNNCPSVQNPYMKQCPITCKRCVAYRKQVRDSLLNLKKG